jgi:peptidoglycan hydrolase-like protein with peptidoglycan-binding domain
MEMQQAYNYSRDAEADYALLKRITKGDRLSDYANEQFQGRIKSIECKSEMAASGIYYLMRENVPVETIELYLDLIELSKQSQNNGGFHIRDSLGHAVQRAFMVHPNEKEDAYFGTNATNLVETFQKYYDYETRDIDGFGKKLKAFSEALAEHPKVNYVIQSAPAKPKGQKL